MSIVKIYSSSGVEWPITVPSNIAEAVAASGSEEALVGGFVDKTVYHGALSGIRDDLSAAVAAVLGVSRKTKVIGKKTDGSDAVAYAETEVDHVERAFAATGTTANEFLARPAADLGETFVSALPEGTLLSSFSTIKDVIIALNPFDAKPRERKPKTPAAPNKADKQLAEAIFNAGRQAEVAQMLGVTGDVTLDTLAIALRNDRIARQREAEEQQKKSLGLL